MHWNTFFFLPFFFEPFRFVLLHFVLRAAELDRARQGKLQQSSDDIHSHNFEFFTFLSPHCCVFFSFCEQRRGHDPPPPPQQSTQLHVHPPTHKHYFEYFRCVPKLFFFLFPFPFFFHVYRIFFLFFLLSVSRAGNTDPTAHKLGGKDLPHGPLSAYVEGKVKERLQKAYELEAKDKEVPVDEVRAIILTEWLIGRSFFGLSVDRSVGFWFAGYVVLFSWLVWLLRWLICACCLVYRLAGLVWLVCWFFSWSVDWLVGSSISWSTDLLTGCLYKRLIDEIKVHDLINWLAVGLVGALLDSLVGGSVVWLNDWSVLFVGRLMGCLEHAPSHKRDCAAGWRPTVPFLLFFILLLIVSVYSFCCYGKRIDIPIKESAFDR